LVVARLLTPSDYGLIALVGAWTIPVALISETGLGAAIIQFRGLGARELNSCFWLVTGLALFGYAGLFVLAPVIASWFGSPALSGLLRVGALTVPLTMTRVVPESLLRKSLRLDRISQAEIAGAMVTIPVVLSMAWAGAGVWALVVQALLMPAVHCVLAFYFAQWHPGLRVGGTQLRELLRYGVTLLIAKIGTMGYEHAETFILGAVSGHVVLGAYSMAKQLATLPVEKIGGVVNQLAFPIMAALQGDIETLRPPFVRGIRLLAWVPLPPYFRFML